MLEIKSFTPFDLDVVTALAREQDFAPGIGDIEIYANTDRQGVWLAWQDNAPVGCIAAVTYNPDYAFIGLFVVKPEHRGQGIGRRLWQHALKTLSGVQCIGLEAAVQMVGFYERAGFQKDCITTRRQMLFRSEASLDASPSQRSDVAVVPLHEVSLRRFSATTNAMRSAQGPTSLSCGSAIGLEMCLQRGMPRVNAMATCAFGLACCRSARAGGWAPGSPKIQAWPRCCSTTPWTTTTVSC